jgi:hypothetical protein
LSLVSSNFFNVGNCSNVVTLKNNILRSLDFQNGQNIRIEKEMGHESQVDRNHESYAPVDCCGLRIFQYPWPHNGYVQDDGKLIYMLACMLVVFAGLVPFATARDANRDSLQHKLRQEQLQRQRWETVMNSTGAARQEALKIYQYHLNDLWDPAP